MYQQNQDVFTKRWWRRGGVGEKQVTKTRN